MQCGGTADCHRRMCSMQGFQVVSLLIQGTIIHSDHCQAQLQTTASMRSIEWDINDCDISSWAGPAISSWKTKQNKGTVIFLVNVAENSSDVAVVICCWVNRLQTEVSARVTKLRSEWKPQYKDISERSKENELKQFKAAFNYHATVNVFPSSFSEQSKEKNYDQIYLSNVERNRAVI